MVHKGVLYPIDKKMVTAAAPIPVSVAQAKKNVKILPRPRVWNWPVG